MSPERIAALRARSRNQAHIVCVHWFAGSGAPKHEPADVEWHEMLDEIERLQGPTRWRDPDDTDGLPDYEPVLVVNPTGGPAVGYHTTDGWGTFGFSDFEVAAWMPVPKFTEVTP